MDSQPLERLLALLAARPRSDRGALNGLGAPASASAGGVHPDSDVRVGRAERRGRHVPLLRRTALLC